MTGTEVVYRAARCASGEILISQEDVERLVDGAIRMYRNTVYSPAVIDKLGWRSSPLEAVRACIRAYQLNVEEATARLATAQDDLAAAERALAAMERGEQ